MAKRVDKHGDQKKTTFLTYSIKDSLARINYEHSVFFLCQEANLTY